MHPTPENLNTLCEAVRTFAEAHPWRHMDPTWNPGTHPGHQLDTDFGYHVVFSITLVLGLPPMRHLSVSVIDAPDRLPNLELVCILATLFGFTNDGKDPTQPSEGWAISIDPMEKCLTVNQPMMAVDRGVMPS